MATTKSRAGSRVKKAGKQEKYSTLHDLLILKLNSLYYTEQKLVQALPKMAKAATNLDLVQAFTDHAVETKNHLTRLEDALTALHEKPKRMPVDAIDGLVKDAAWCITNIKDPKALDAALIAAAQYVEHYETAGYGAAREWAALMEHTVVMDLLRDTLIEEEAADSALNELALGGINEQVPTGMDAPTVL